MPAGFHEHLFDRRAIEIDQDRWPLTRLPWAREAVVIPSIRVTGSASRPD